MKRWNQKGMTLIEVIVVLLLSSILMVIAGGLLLDSMGYFNKTAQSSYEKQAVDAISSYVREQLVYATEVQIATEKPDKSDDWHWLSVDKNYHLTRDNETVYNDGFYRGRRLKILAKHYDEYRLDLSFAFTDEKDKQVYRTATTFELVNIKAKTEKGEDIKNSGIKGSEQKIGDTTSDSGIYKIYYKVSGALDIKDDVDPNHPDIDYGEPTDPKFEGTVYDELNCRDKDVSKPGEKGNNKGQWKSGNDYKVGDFVEYNGVTYRCVKKSENGKNPQENQGNCWKPIDPPYWQAGASYLKDDVVIYKVNGKYYQAEKNINNSNHNPVENNGEKWEELDEEDLKEIIEEHRGNDFCKIDDDNDDFSEDSWTVGGEKERCPSSERKWNNNETIHPGDYVEYPINSNQWYRYIFSTDLIPGNQTGTWYPGGAAREHWKKIDKNWYGNSTYYKGDIVVYDGKYYQAIREINGAWSPGIPNTGWSDGYSTIEELLEHTKIEVTCKVY